MHILIYHEGCQKNHFQTGLCKEGIYESRSVIVQYRYGNSIIILTLCGSKLNSNMAVIV